MKNRLQIVHNNTLFKSSEEAINYVKGNLESINRPSLYAEPMILKYGDENNPNIILAIGSNGDGITPSMNNKTFFIDFARLDTDVQKIIEEQGSNEELIKRIEDAFNKIIISCGLKENGEYDAESIEDDLILSNSTNIFQAVKILSEYIQNHEKKNKLKTENTPSLNLHINDEENVVLSGEVNLSKSKTVDRTIFDNQILLEKDGIFHNVDFHYDNETSEAIFSVNGEEKRYSLPKDTFITGGKYNPDNESLELTLNHEVNWNGEKISTIKIDMQELIGEWGVLPINAQTSPIILTKQPMLSQRNLHENKMSQDILSADVRIASSEEKPLNILKKTVDGRSLYVDGSARNIAYWDKNGNKTTVNDALNSIKCNVSNQIHNIIVEKNDGIYANVSLNYDALSNTLKFNDGIHEEKSIKLNSAELINDVRYDKPSESIVITFKLADGTTKIIKIPVSDIITEWTVSNEGKNVTLEKIRSGIDENQDILTANVNVATYLEDNILENKGNALYVKGTADNIKYGQSTVEEELLNLNQNIHNEEVARKETDNKLESSILSEATKRETADNQLKNDIESAKNAAISSSNEKFNSLKEELTAEVNRSKNEDKRLSNIVEENKSLTVINKEDIKKLQEKDIEIVHSIDLINSKYTTIDKKVDDLKITQDEIKNNVFTNANDLAKEIERAKAKETEINNNLEKEVTRAGNVEETISKDVESLKQSINVLNSDKNVIGSVRETVYTALNPVKADLENEINRAKEVEKTLENTDKEIKTEVGKKIETVVLEKNPNNNLEYYILVDGVKSGANINIPSDMVVKSGAVVKGTWSADGDKFTEGAGNDKALKLVIANQEEPIYINTIDLVKDHTAGFGINISDVNEISVVIDNTSEKYLTLSENGIKLSGIEEALNEKADSLQIDTLATKEELKNISDKVDIINGNEAQEGSLRKNLSDANKYTDDERNRAENAEKSLLEGLKTKANISDVYSKHDIDSKGYIDSISAQEYAKRVDVDNNAKEIQNVKGELNNIKFNPVASDTIENKFIMLEGIKNLSSEVKLATMQENILKKNSEGLYASVKMSYNKATNVITFNNGNGDVEYQLSSKSLLTSAHYDSDTKEIVLILSDGEGGTSEIRIPVNELVNEFSIKNDVKSPVKLKEETNSDGIKELSAYLEISSAKNNLIDISNGNLYVSNDAKDHKVVFNTNEVSVQTAISSLEDAVKDVPTTEGINQMKNDIRQLQDEAIKNNLKVEDIIKRTTTMEEKVNKMETTVSDVNQKVLEIQKLLESMEIPQLDARLKAIETDLSTLIDFGTTDSIEPTPETPEVVNEGFIM